MKKLIAILLALVMILAVFAGCGKEETPEQTENATEEVTEEVAVEAPASALEILEKIWALYGEGEAFSVFGGDMAYHNAQMMEDENYMIPSAPGKFALTETDELIYQKLVPEAETSKITDAATMTHLMNGNNFTCGVYRVSAADAEGFAAAMKDAVSGNQWLCGMPESLLIANIAQEYVLVAWGVNDAMDPFEAKLQEAYPEAQIVYNEAIA